MPVLASLKYWQESFRLSQIRYRCVTFGKMFVQFTDDANAIQNTYTGAVDDEDVGYYLDPIPLSEPPSIDPRETFEEVVMNVLIPQ